MFDHKKTVLSVPLEIEFSFSLALNQLNWSCRFLRVFFGIFLEFWAFWAWVFSKCPKKAWLSICHLSNVSIQKLTQNCVLPEDCPCRSWERGHMGAPWFSWFGRWSGTSGTCRTTPVSSVPDTGTSTQFWWSQPFLSGRRHRTPRRLRLLQTHLGRLDYTTEQCPGSLWLLCTCCKLGLVTNLIVNY